MHRTEPRVCERQCLLPAPLQPTGSCPRAPGARHSLRGPRALLWGPWVLPGTWRVATLPCSAQHVVGAQPRSDPYGELVPRPEGTGSEGPGPRAVRLFLQETWRRPGRAHAAEGPAAGRGESTGGQCPLGPTMCRCPAPPNLASGARRRLASEPAPQRPLSLAPSPLRLGRRLCRPGSRPSLAPLPLSGGSGGPLLPGLFPIPPQPGGTTGWHWPGLRTLGCAQRSAEPAREVGSRGSPQCFRVDPASTRRVPSAPGVESPLPSHLPETRSPERPP